MVKDLISFFVDFLSFLEEVRSGLPQVLFHSLGELADHSRVQVFFIITDHVVDATASSCQINDHPSIALIAETDDKYAVVFACALLGDPDEVLALLNLAIGQHEDASHEQTSLIFGVEA